ALAWPNVALHFLDEAISAAEADGQDTTAYYNSAVTVVREALDEITGIRATYTTVLSTQEAVMTASTGYHPQVIDDFDGAADDDPTPAAQRYDQTHRDADQALVDHAQQTGEWTDDARAAAARLRDSATVADPDAPAEARRLAGERLDDYNNATFIGPLPQDTVLGGDARSTARTRLALQRQLEAGEFAPGYKAMTADEATKLLDQVEAKARVNALRGLQLQLQQAGMTPEGAAKVVDGIAQGTVPQEYVDAASAAGSAFGAGEDAIKKFSELVPTGRHWGPGTAFSADDIKALGRLGGRVGFVGNVIDLGNAVYDLTHGVSPAEVAAKTGGGMLGAWSYGTLGMTAGGFIAGPPGAFIGALLLGTYGSIKGQEAGEKALHWVTE
ncbi:hypothetical protein H7J07_19100, partial [Mycobacterium koreense]|nr:hypothetical protein [Mycolicibacillus koreensis]